MVPGAVAWVLVPFVASPKEDHTPRRTLHVARGVILVTGVSIVVAALVGPWLLPILFGSAFQASVMPFLLLLPGAFGFVFMAIFSSGLIAASSPGRSSARSTRLGSADGGTRLRIDPAVRCEWRGRSSFGRAHRRWSRGPRRVSARAMPSPGARSYQGGTTRSTSSSSLGAS